MTLMCGEKWLETGNPFVEGDMSESKEQWLIAENERLTKENERNFVVGLAGGHTVFGAPSQYDKFMDKYITWLEMRRSNKRD